MKILLFGGSGQLGGELREKAKDLSFEVVAPVTKEVDISDREQVIHLVKKVIPDIIINSAAYTAVDKAESERDRAFEINATGVKIIGEAAREVSARVIHISTDYVFSGETTEPLDETAETRPINVYGESKLAGEKFLLELYPENSLVVRTASLHGALGENFVHTMLRLFKEKDSISVVNDQIMSPTYTGWLAEVLLDLSRMKEVIGVLHAAGQGAISWFDFASEIKRQKGAQCEIRPVSHTEFKRDAKRPMYSALSTRALAAILGRPSISWKEGLRLHLERI